MQRIAWRLAFSNCCSDQSAHTGSFSTTSRMTFVSTRINASVPAPSKGHDLAGAHLYGCNTAQARETVGRPFRSSFGPAQYHIAAWSQFKDDGGAGFNPEQVSNLLGNRNLPFGCERRCHLQ